MSEFLKRTASTLAAIAIAVALLIGGFSIFTGNGNAQTSACVQSWKDLNTRQHLGMTDADINAKCAAVPTTTTATTSAATTTVPPTTAPATTAAPTTVPTVTPTTSAPVSTAPGTCPGDHEILKGDPPYSVSAGCNVKGDVRVGASVTGPWNVLYDSDAKSGVLLSCVTDCFVWAEFGANVSPRSLDDLENEMHASGCVGGCTTVRRFTWPMASSPSITVATVAAATPTTSITVVTTIGATSGTVVPTVDVCDPSIPKGQKLFIKGDGQCVVTGDVAVATSQNGPFKPLYDSDQATGLVVEVTHDMWFFAPWGASANGGSVKDNVDALRAVGCGLPNGCPKVITVTV